MKALTTIAKRLRGKTDAELEAERDRLREAETAFTRANVLTKEDRHEAIDGWLEQVGRGVSERAALPSLTSGGRNANADAVLEVIAAWALKQPSFRSWLETFADGQGSLTVAEREAGLAKIREPLQEIETELARRGVEARKAELERELAALGGDAA